MVTVMYANVWLRTKLKKLLSETDWEELDEKSLADLDEMFRISFKFCD